MTICGSRDRWQTMVRFGFLCVLVAAVAAGSRSQTAPAASHGTVERIKVHGSSLEGNLEGDPADRDVSVYLPPSYATHKHQRYPVLYLLHGYIDNDINWFGEKHVFVDAPQGDRWGAGEGLREGNDHRDA